MIHEVTANTYHRFMDTGRTSPVLLGCYGTDHDNEKDYIVKLAGGMEMGTRHLLYEFIAAELATFFEIPHPPAAFVRINSDIASLIATSQPAKAAIINGSIGINFGTEKISNLQTWPVDRTLPASLVETASTIFAFDALIQNPDRRFKNPNLGTVGDGIQIYDHDCGFSFLLDIFSEEAWKATKQKYLTEHVFYSSLRRVNFEFTNFIERLVKLPSDFIDQFRSNIPESWQVQDLDRISGHLISVREHAQEFELELRRMLA